MDPAPRPTDEQMPTTQPGPAGGEADASSRLEAMRRRLGDLRAAEPQWQFGSAMNDMLGADTAPIRPPAAPEPAADDPDPGSEAELAAEAGSEPEPEMQVATAGDRGPGEAEAPMIVGLAEDDPVRSALDVEQAMEQVEDQARRLRELAAEALDEPGEPDEDEGDGRGAAGTEPLGDSAGAVAATEQFDEAGEAGETAESGGPPVTPSMEFVTDSEQRYREHAESAAPDAAEDLPEDELAAALESMLQGPAADAEVPTDEPAFGGDGDEARAEPAEVLDQTLERIIDEGRRTDLDPPADAADAGEEPGVAAEGLEPGLSEGGVAAADDAVDAGLDVDDVSDLEAEAEADAEAVADPSMPVSDMGFVGDAEDLFESAPEAVAEEATGEPLAPVVTRPTRRSSLKAVRGALAAKAATLEPLKKALGNEALGEVDESSLSRDEMKALMVDLDRTLAEGVDTLLESSYEAVADILDLVFEEVEEPDENESELLEESEDEVRSGGRRREERPSREASPSEGGDRSPTAADEQLDDAGEMAGIDDLDVEFDEVDLDEPGGGGGSAKARPAPGSRGRTGRISPPRPAGPGLRERLVAVVREFRGDFSGAGARVVHGAMAAMSRPLDHVPPDWRTTVDWIAISLAFWVPIVWLLVAFVF